MDPAGGALTPQVLVVPHPSSSFRLISTRSSSWVASWPCVCVWKWELVAGTWGSIHVPCAHRLAPLWRGILCSSGLQAWRASKLHRNLKLEKMKAEWTPRNVTFFWLMARTPPAPHPASLRLTSSSCEEKLEIFFIRVRLCRRSHLLRENMSLLIPHA